jgi:hypothetical protein
MGMGMLVAGSLVAMGHGTPLFRAAPGAPFQPFNSQILIVTLFVAYPALELTLSVIRRVFRGRPIYIADQGHIHHRLLKKGWTPPGIVGVAVAVSILPGLAALSTLMDLKGWAAWCMVFSALFLGLGLPLLGFLDFLTPHFLAHHRPYYRIAHHFIAMQKIKLSLARTREEVLALVDQACLELGVKAYRLIIPADGQKQGGLDYTRGFDPTRSAAQGEEGRGPVDRIRLFGGAGGAKWMFESQPQEEDLDVEYRVLISEFIKDALVAVAHLGQNQPTLEIPSVIGLPRQKVSGHQLRKRQPPKQK